MPTEARVYCSIWRDPQFLALPRDVQGTYMFLFSQADISMCGLLHVRETLWASKAAGLTGDQLREHLALLAAARFVVIDAATQELLVRARIRRDNVVNSMKLIKPLVFACQAVESGPIRGVLAAELRRALDEGLVHDRIITEVERLAADLEKSGGDTAGLLFSQVDRVSSETGMPYRDFRDRAQGTGDRGQGTGEGGSGGDSALVPARPAVRRQPAADAGFDEFWAAYPRKTGKGAAREAWRKARKKGADPAVLIAAIIRYRDSPGRTQRYTPNPATWLNQERWDDDPDTVSSPRSNGQNETDALFERARQRIASRKESAP